jgi:hypothetical protein
MEKQLLSFCREKFNQNELANEKKLFGKAML